ncbi:hypothetical protein J2755_000584 [Methanohalophilus levihalophilus]|uniref:hypothetical protein n=1 Tax=Methanohalophilus levihalophilus TaxID=1431282 RepID=UPI001AE3099F|nr:hypothetical protein [Methanohalophilus levihalophilus]MBP2029664.1 hypothetical protein [Methanohalophilus levihalophilus]
MIRLENMLPKAFLVGIMEMVDRFGPEETFNWIVSIGTKLAEIEGPGFEGARENHVNFLPVCPFGSDFVEFVEMYGGEQPSQFLEIIDYVNKQKETAEDGWNYPALSGVLGILHYSYSKKRAELAGAELLSVGTKSPLTDEFEYNYKAIEKAGMTKEEVDKYLDKSYCVFKIDYHDKE